MDNTIHLLEEIDPVIPHSFEDRLFPCSITRDENNKKKVYLPKGWNNVEKEFDDFEMSNSNSVALRTGNGLVIIDIDTKDSNLLDPKFANLVTKWLNDKATFIVETTNGYHFYFDSGENSYSNSVRVSDNVDIRGDGGCVFCFTRDPKSSYNIFSGSEPLPFTDELQDYLKQKEPTQVTYSINDKNLKITDTPHEYNKDLASAIQNGNVEDFLRSIGFSLDDFITTDGLYSKLNRMAFILAMNPACPNNQVRYVLESFIEHHFNFDPHSSLSIEKIDQIFSNMIYCNEDEIEDIFEDAFVSIKELEKMMVNSVPVLGNFILKGQLSFIYGTPNSGKSLLMMSLLQNSPEQIHYLNADDGITEAVNKFKIAEKYGHSMIVCGSNEKNDPRVILQKMERALSLSPHYYKDKIIILDTVKKFVDVMAKKDVRNFLQIMRKITLSGGTVVLLGHTNKHRTKGGELIFEGVGDFLSDMDCIYELDTNTDLDNKEKTITLTNKKLRGSVPSTVSYTYSSDESIDSFEDRMLTINLLSDAEQKKKLEEAKKAKTLAKYSNLHPLITSYLRDNPKSSQSSIINYVKDHEDCSDSIKVIRLCLNELSGIKWSYEYNKLNNNTKEFSVMNEIYRFGNLLKK